MKPIMLILLLCGFLQGCINAAVTSAQVVYDHRHIKHSLNDRYITMQAYHNVYTRTHRYKNTNVSITTFNQVVLLTGQVHNEAQKIEIEDIIHKIPGVKEVYNQIEIIKDISTLTEISDAWITTKIKAQMIATDSIDPDNIKVVTENGTVFLLGIVPPDQAEATVNIARTTAGVQNVVKIFSYLRISKA